MIFTTDKFDLMTLKVYVRYKTVIFIEMVSPKSALILMMRYTSLVKLKKCSLLL